MSVEEMYVSDIITYHHGYTKKNNGIYHAIKSHECPGQRGFDFHECPRGFVGKKGCYFFHPHLTLKCKLHLRKKY